MARSRSVFTPDRRADIILDCVDCLCGLWKSLSFHFFSSPNSDSSTSVWDPASSWSSSGTLSYFDCGCELMVTVYIICLGA